MHDVNKWVAWVMQCYLFSKEGIKHNITKTRQETAIKLSQHPSLTDNLDSNIIVNIQFAVCALIDEWMFEQGIASWQQYPLQVEFFNDYTAGEVFFERLDSLKKAHTKNELPLLIYYICLQLGFKGKYLDPASSELNKLKRTLYSLLHPPLENTKQDYKMSNKHECQNHKKHLMALLSTIILVWSTSKAISLYQSTTINNDLHIIELLKAEKPY